MFPFVELSSYTTRKEVRLSEPTIIIGNIEDTIRHKRKRQRGLDERNGDKVIEKRLTDRLCMDECHEFLSDPLHCKKNENSGVC